MIFDSVPNLPKYFPKFTKVLDKITEILQQPFEEQVILFGKHKFILSQYHTSQPTYAESHQIYSDIQILIQGEEHLELYNKLSTQIHQPYSDKFDVELYYLTGKPTNITLLQPNQFIYYAPGEIHRPGIMIDTQTCTRKLVVKLNEH